MSRRWWLVGIAALMMVTGCASDTLLSVDRSVQFTSPAHLATVTAPVRVTWRAEDLPEAASRYAVFVDRRPLAPGHNLRQLADDTCRRSPGCPDEQYLRDLGIFLTRSQEVVLDTLPVLGGMVARDHPVVHQVTVVLIDEQGDRVGEYAYDLQFRLSEQADGG